MGIAEAVRFRWKTLVPLLRLYWTLLFRLKVVEALLMAWV